MYETRPVMRTCIVRKLDFEKTCKTRSKGGCIPFEQKCVKFNNSFCQTLWIILPRHIQFNIIEEFKLCTKKEFKPPRYKRFAMGSKQGLEDSD